MLHLSFVAALLSLIDTAAVCTYSPQWGYNYSFDYVVQCKILILMLMRFYYHYLCANNQRTDANSQVSVVPNYLRNSVPFRSLLLALIHIDLNGTNRRLALRYRVQGTEW